MGDKKRVPDYLKEALVRYCEGRDCDACIFEMECPDPHNLQTFSEDDDKEDTEEEDSS